MLIDDEESVGMLVKHILAAEGYDFCYATSGEEGLARIGDEQPNLVIVDVMMSGLSGFQVCRRIREQGLTIPVIFLSARSDIVDKGEGFDAGGDDYMTKPFDPRELAMHVKAHLKSRDRVHVPDDGCIHAGNIEIDIKRHIVLVNGEEKELTAKEFQILYVLAGQPGEVFTREQLVREVWGPDYSEETVGLSVFVRRIRKKIEADSSCPIHLVTVRNVGYRFEN